jgi:GNAT superfamily N-acetyltransferase
MQSDYPLLVEILNICWPDEQSTANELWERETLPQSKAKCARFVYEEAGQIVATARYYQLPGRYHPDRFWLEIDVHPLHRNKGIGSALVDYLLKETEQKGATLVRFAINDARTTEIAFLEKREFREEWRSWELARKLDDLEPKVLRTEAAAILAKNNAEVIKLAAAWDKGLQRECYQVNEQTRLDNAWNDPVTEWGLENYLRSISQNVNPDAGYVAMVDGQVVALCVLGKGQPGSEDVDHNWTGVLPTFRGRGLAHALKKLVLADAKELGYKRVTTTCNSGNKPMLTLNAEFGFEKLYSWVYMARHVGADAIVVPGLPSHLHVRQAEIRDLNAICELRNLSLGGEITPEYVETMWASQPPSWPFIKLVVETGGGKLVSYIQSFHMPNFGEGVHFLTLEVQPDWQQQGIGSVLLSYMEQTSGASTFRLAVRDDRPHAIKFAKDRGYIEYQHMFASVADLTQVDVAAILQRKGALEAKGIRFCSYADLGDSADHRRKLHELYNTADRDTPGSEKWGAYPFESFEAECFKTERHDPHGIFVAVDGNEWVALSMVFRINDDTYGTAFTGTVREYRGRGIAATLKALAVLYAKSQGAKSMRTDNDTRNAPMLAINSKLGFKPEFGRRMMQKQLSKPATGEGYATD